MTIKTHTTNSIFFTTLFLISASVPAQSRILVDGEYTDWEAQPVLTTDATGDGGASGVDFKKVQAFNDRDYLFFYLEVGSVINLQDVNSVAIYLDIDNNANTGSSSNGIGAELIYTYGNRSGFYNSASIGHDAIGLITAPTVSADKFEIAIKRAFTINGNTVNMGNTIKFLFKDNTPKGDAVPSANGGIAYTFTDTQLEALPSFSMAKPSTSDLRILSYNVERDGFFTVNRVPSYTRILKAVQPDIIGFQEIYNNSSAQIAAQVETMLPSGAGEQWYYAGAEPDCHAVSRFPILKSSKIEGSGGSGNGAFLIDIPDSETDMLLVVAHPPCCSNDAGRQQEVDLIMQFIREAKDGRGPISLETGAPIVIVGDMNFVGDAAQLQTLLTGNISNNATYGSDFKPDWDGSNLVDSKAYATNVPFAYTWYSESSAFSPGRLDYILYSGSNLKLDNTFSLFTPGLAADSLTAYSLFGNDVLTASDHLPLVADFTLKNKATNDIRTKAAQQIDLQINPNPAYGQTVIEFTHPKSGQVTIQITDLNGREVQLIYNGILKIGSQNISFDASTNQPGTYFIKTTTSEAVYYKRISVVR